MTEFATFEKFYTMEDARPVLEILKAHSIPVELVQGKDVIDRIIIGVSSDPLIELRIPPDRFPEAHTLLENEFSPAPAQTDEVLEVISDIMPEHLRPAWIVVGYLLSLIPVVGIFLGVTLISSTRRLPDGGKIPMYDEPTITHGRIMIAVAVIRTILFLYFILS